MEVFVCMLSHSVLSDSLWSFGTVSRQAPMSMGFSRQEYWSGLSFPPPGKCSNPGIEPASPASLALQEDSLLLSCQESPASLWPVDLLTFYKNCVLALLIQSITEKVGIYIFFIELIASVIEVSSVNVKKTAYTTAIVFWVGWGGGFPKWLYW